MPDARFARERLDTALMWVACLEGVEQLVGSCDSLHDVNPGALVCLLGKIHDGLDSSLNAAFQALVERP